MCRRYRSPGGAEGAGKGAACVGTRSLLLLAARPQQCPPWHTRMQKGQGQGNHNCLCCSPQFLRVSLEHIKDKAWTMNLSQELSQQLGSAAPGFWQKMCLLPLPGLMLALVRQGEVGSMWGQLAPKTASRTRALLFQLFLYKALGTTLAACWDLRHVRGQVLRLLQETDPAELPEIQVRRCSYPEQNSACCRAEGGSSTPPSFPCCCHSSHASLTWH